jgi:hypothetical protein
MIIGGGGSEWSEGVSEDWQFWLFVGPPTGDVGRAAGREIEQTAGRAILRFIDHLIARNPLVAHVTEHGLTALDRLEMANVRTQIAAVVSTMAHPIIKTEVGKVISRSMTDQQIRRVAVWAAQHSARPYPKFPRKP